MESTAHVHGHPVHPMLIPYPFALLTSAVLFDVAAAKGEDRANAQTAKHLTNAGLLSALVAAVPGIVDYFGSVPRHTTAKRSATIHALTNVTALVCLKSAQSHRDENGRLDGAGLGLAIAGGLALCVGGWLGGELVYREHLGVQDAHPRSRQLTGHEPHTHEVRTLDVAVL